jgi:hypothetical protein
VAHAYVVSSATYIPGSSADPAVTIIGTVDGVPVTVETWLSAITAANTAGGLTAVKNLVSPLMLAQAGINVPQAPIQPAQLPTGSWSQ